ncbi:hypothetical protein AVEN_254128-1 [Araneus ventricosus]|uniref:Uncharacterized protein n=1 Tax=Araneus ventricosus TaxID=182803 RepID=A0A4Y2BZ54_ARAVE|nr:hypothetical protein AVEN_254128-1 [Araneus ventricosus]
MGVSGGIMIIESRPFVTHLCINNEPTHLLWNCVPYEIMPLILIEFGKRKIHTKLGTSAREFTQKAYKAEIRLVYIGAESKSLGVNSEGQYSLQMSPGLLWKMILVVREQGTRFDQSHFKGRNKFRGYRIIVRAGISLGRHSELHTRLGGTVIGARYRDETHDAQSVPKTWHMHIFP